MCFACLPVRFNKIRYKIGFFIRGGGTRARSHLMSTEMFQCIFPIACQHAGACPGSLVAGLVYKLSRIPAKKKTPVVFRGAAQEGSWPSFVLASCPPRYRPRPCLCKLHTGHTLGYMAAVCWFGGISAPKTVYICRDCVHRQSSEQRNSCDMSSTLYSATYVRCAENASSAS
jgi:hypothetical protein